MLYRYFASQDDLIGVLCVDAYQSCADALEAAREAEPIEDHARRWWAICHAFRQWSLANPADFALIFGAPVPGYHAPKQVTGPAAGRFISVPLGVFAAAAQAGAADPDRTQAPAKLDVGELFQDLLDRAAPDYLPRLAGLVLNAWVSILGYLAMETSGILPRLIRHTDQLYGAHVRPVMLGLGFDPAAVARVRARRKTPTAGPVTSTSGQRPDVCYDPAP